MMKVSTISKVKVRYGETDQMGVVYHGNYAQFLEIGRIDWLNQLGFSYKKMEEEGVMLPVVNLNTNFKAPAYFDDELTIVTSIIKKPTVKIEFYYEVYNQNKDLLTTGSTVLVFVSTETRRPIKCPVDLLQTIESYPETETP